MISVAYKFEDIVAQLKRLADANGILPSLKYPELRRCKTWLERHGYNYIQVLDENGLFPRATVRLDYEGLIEALRKASKERGHLPPAGELHRMGLLYVVYKYFNTIDEAAQAAGVVSRRMYLRKEKDRCLECWGADEQED